jgi:hypothetical protein
MEVSMEPGERAEVVVADSLTWRENMAAVAGKVVKRM